MTRNELPDISGLSDRNLLRLYALVMRRLRENLVKTGNSPVGEYGEILAAQAYGGTPEGFSNKGYDVLTATLGRLQVKTATVDTGKQPVFSVVRGLRDGAHDFDHALFIVLDRETFDVTAAWLVTRERLHQLASYSAHVNGSRVTASTLRKATAMGTGDVTDVRDVLIQAQLEHESQGDIAGSGGS